MKFDVVYVPIGVGTYEMVSAHESFDSSVKLLKSIDESIIGPDDILLTVDAVGEFMIVLVKCILGSLKGRKRRHSVINSVKFIYCIAIVAVQQIKL